MSNVKPKPRTYNSFYAQVSKEAMHNKSIATLKALLLINAGAAVAILSFLSSLITKHNQSININCFIYILTSLVMFTSGVLSTAINYKFSELAQYYSSKKNDFKLAKKFPKAAIMDSKSRRYVKLYNFFTIISLITFILGIIYFILGIYQYLLLTINTTYYYTT